MTDTKSNSSQDSRNRHAPHDDKPDNCYQSYQSYQSHQDHQSYEYKEPLSDDNDDHSASELSSEFIERHTNESMLAKAENESIKLVAIYEVIKGASALIAAAALFVWHIRFFDWLETTDSGWSEQFGRLLAPPMDALITLAHKISQNWVLFLFLILGYASVRFVEAYGLFKDKIWAYWFGVLGYGMFIPLEIYYLIVKPFDWLKLAALILNCIVVYVVYKQMRRKGLI